MKHLIVLVDALGWLTVERLGFLQDLLPQRSPLTTVFGYSCTAIPSLLTGAWPDEHGHWFLYKRSKQSPFREAGWIDRFPGAWSRKWRVRQLCQAYWRKRRHIRGYFSLYEIPFRMLPRLEPVEREDTWSRGAFPGFPTLVDVLEAGRCHVSDWRVSDDEKIAAASEAVRRSNPETVVLYLTEVDAAQHRWGTRHSQFENAVRRAGDRVREMNRRMAALGPVSLQVFSDHGMTDITRNEDLHEYLADHNLRAGRDFEVFYDSTVARFWNMRDVNTLKSVLGGLPWGSVLTTQQLKDWRVHFPHGEYGDLFFLADPGVLIVPSHMGSRPLAAMHGYTPEDPTSDACFLSNTPLKLAANHITAIFPALTDHLGVRGE